MRVFPVEEENTWFSFGVDARRVLRAKIGAIWLASLAEQR